MDLKEIYLTTLARCAPDLLVREFVRRDMPRHVVAIGKCAAALLDGVAAVHPVESAFAAIPEGYPLPATRAEVHIGGHPHMNRASFEAGRALTRYVDAHEDILFLISGGGSACVEVPLVDEDAIIRANADLIASGRPIGAINAERRRMSAIKGGKLAERVRGRAVTLVYSDVSSGALADVASGPTLPGSEAVLVADNTTLVRRAAQIIGDNAIIIEEQIEGDVLEAASRLAAWSGECRPASASIASSIMVAGGEPTVVVRGTGRGGRCSELAVRFATISRCEAVFASSDGVDGNSGSAGIYLPRRERIEPRHSYEEALRRSDSFSVAAQIGEPIMITPTGNNLRDLFLVACV